MSTINRDEVKGKAQQGKGWVKDKFGEITGDRQTEAEGEAERAEGEGRESWGKVKRGVSDAVDAVGDTISNTADKINR
ncbi:MAG: CsbD family protein [Blastocatellia bacterium]|nr:CsbD family protein [Blastocatellia bacterium]